MLLHFSELLVWIDVEWLVCGQMADAREVCAVAPSRDSHASAQ